MKEELKSSRALRSKIHLGPMDVCTWPFTLASYFIDNVRGVVALKSQSRTIELSMCYATKFYLVGHVPPIHDSYRICFVRCVIPLFLSAGCICARVCVCACVWVLASELQPASHCSVCWYAEIVVEANDSLYRTRSGTQTKTHRVTDIFDNVRAVHCTQHYRSISLCESVCACVWLWGFWCVCTA